MVQDDHEGRRAPQHEAGAYHSFAIGKIPACPFSRMSASRGFEPIPMDKSRKRERTAPIDSVANKPTQSEQKQYSAPDKKWPPSPRRYSSGGPEREFFDGEWDEDQGPPGEAFQEPFLPFHTTAIYESRRKPPSPPRISLWSIASGWETRPRPKTSQAYQSLGRHTSASGQRHGEDRYSSRPSSSFSSTTKKYSSLMFENDFLDLKPKQDQTCLHSPGPKYNVRTFPAPKWRHRLIVPDRLFGKSLRFQPGRTFVPKTFGPDRLYLPCEKQVRPNPKSCTSVLAGRQINGSIYQDGHYRCSPGPKHHIFEASNKVSTRRFPPKSTCFGAPRYGPHLRQSMLDRGRSEIQRMLDKMKEQAPLSDDISVRSASARSIYHSSQWDAVNAKRKEKGGKPAGSWTAMYADCLSVATYAGKIHVQCGGNTGW